MTGGDILHSILTAIAQFSSQTAVLGSALALLLWVYAAYRVARYERRRSWAIVVFAITTALVLVDLLLIVVYLKISVDADVLQTAVGFIIGIQIFAAMVILATVRRHPIK